jgi:hypothetical protein
MYFGPVVEIAIATQHGHASCGHELEAGDLFARATITRSACLECAMPHVIDCMRENATRCGVSTRKIDRAVDALRGLLTGPDAAEAREGRWVEYDDTEEERRRRRDRQDLVDSGVAVGPECFGGSDYPAVNEEERRLEVLSTIAPNLFRGSES